MAPSLPQSVKEEKLLSKMGSVPSLDLHVQFQETFKECPSHEEKPPFTIFKRRKTTCVVDEKPLTALHEGSRNKKCNICNAH